MNTPIVDFVKGYVKKDMSRFHMPGHKGKGFLGCEEYDITEIGGADVLSQAEGIIKMSEDNASALFDTAHSFYIAQGSSTGISAMLSLVKKTESEKTLILAARNVHKAFIHAAALLDLDVKWLTNESSPSILKCEITPDLVEQKIKESSQKPSAVYLTSPDYLGNMQNIREISLVCKKFNIPLLVDNAHGAYLKFLEKSLHPIDLGATLACDSAHKTLPVLTGGAYLHISKDAPKEFLDAAREKISLFSSTSPSYLILQSLDMCNLYLDKDYKKDLSICIEKTDEIKKYIKEKGFNLTNSEPLKLVIKTQGEHLAKALREHDIEPEFYDRDYLVLMITPQNRLKDFKRLKRAFSHISPDVKKPRENKITLPSPIRKMSIRDAVLSPSETVETKNAEGRICAAPTVSCPPAVPIAVSGEEITKEIIELLKYYGIDKIKVVKQI